MDLDFRELWWSKVPTALQLIDKTKQLLHQGKSIAYAGVNTEWNNSYLQAVIRSWRDDFSDIGFYELDLAELQDMATITDGIADYFGIGYLNQRKVSELIPDLPPEGSVWILQNVTPKREKELEKLMRHVRETHAPLMFIYKKAGDSNIKGFEQLSISPNKLDLSYFAWTVLLGTFPDEIIEYGAALAVELSDGQPMECGKICSEMHQCMHDPLSYCSGINEAKVISKVHTAQVRIIEPLIEYGRVYLINKLGKRAEVILPFTDEYNNTFVKPIEIELRNIIYYRHNLHMDQEEQSLANMLYSTRNKISHLELLTYEEVQLIIHQSQKWIRESF